MPGDTAALVGKTVAARYLLTESLGTAALFAVFRAQDQTQNRTVAVKTLLPAYASDEIVGALRRGVGDILPLSDPSLVRPLDAGDDAALGVRFFLAEESARGLDLAERIRRGAPLAQTASVEIAIAIVGALRTAAERGVTHGDLRPANVLLSGEPPVRVAGWGVAEAQAIAAGTSSAFSPPSAPYIAPEVWARGRADGAGDLYAVGVMLYEMLTGALPFAASGDALAIARRVAEEPVPSLKALQPAVPRALDAVVQKLLAKRPADRYASPDALLADLRRLRDGLRFGRPLTWSPADGDPPASVRAGFDAGGTAVMPTGAAIYDDSATLAPRAPEPTVVTRVPPPPTPEPVMPPAAAPVYDTALAGGEIRTPAPRAEAEEDDTISTTMPAPRPRRRVKPIWLFLVPLNLALSIGLVFAVKGLVHTLLLGTTATTDVVVPNLVGKSLTEARTMGEERKFVVDVTDSQFSDKYAEDTIYQMRPEPGRHIRENKKIEVWVSKGPHMVTVPDLGDMSVDKARGILEKLGLRLGDTKSDYDPITVKGNVLRQEPPQGENRPRGTPVDLTLSRGPEPVSTPSPEPTPAPELSDLAPYVNTERHSLTLKYVVPAEGGMHTVRVDVTDSSPGNETRTLIPDEVHNAGETVTRDVEGVGKKITFRVYDNDQLVQTVTGPPFGGTPPAKENKKP